MRPAKQADGGHGRPLWVVVGVLLLAGAYALGYFSGQRSNRLASAAKANRTLQELDAAARRPLSFYRQLSGPAPPSHRSPVAAASPPPAPPPPALPVTAPPAPDGPAPKAPESAAAPTSFALQVGAWRTSAEAEAIARALRRQGFAAYVQRATVQSGMVWHRVRLGHFHSRRAAQQQQATLRRADIEAMLVRLP